MNLNQLQYLFHTFILNDNKNTVKIIRPCQKLSTQQSINIYKNSYFERFIAALKQDFPVLCAHLGEGAFRGLIIDYIKNNPSNHFSLRYVGKYLPEFIKNSHESFLPYSDLAQYEWLMCRVECNEAIFQSNYNIQEVWNAFYLENKLIPLKPN